jgi:hypothetical protein
MTGLHSLRVRLIVVIMLIVIAACTVLALFSMSQQARLTDRALDREMRSDMKRRRSGWWRHCWLQTQAFVPASPPGIVIA